MLDETAQFRELGFIAPVRVLTAEACAKLVRDLALEPPPKPAIWFKGRWINDRRFYDLATCATLRTLMRSILGPDVILWGVDIHARETEQRHPWHVDIESFSPEGGFASVWIGIENSSRESGLQLISHSHRCGEPIQKVAKDKGCTRGEVEETQALAWVRERVAEARLIEPEVGDGDAIVFDGRIWHGSNNRRPGGRRLAVTLHYARADRPVRILDLDHLEWPFTRDERPRAPVIAIAGQADEAVNWVVKLKAETSPNKARGIYDLKLPLADDPEAGWKSHPVFARTTSIFDRVTCHASVLSPGHSPHPPHRHDEEELLIMLDGEADLMLQHPEKPGELISLKARRGAAMYFPSDCAHTIRNSSDLPATYVMFSWMKQGTTGPGTLKPAMLNALALPKPDPGVEFLPRPIFHEATRHLAGLHCHVSDLIPGGISPPHVDDHDALVILLSGRLNLLGQPMRPNGFVYIPAGEIHGFVNDGDEVARYIVFEFHASARGAAARRAATVD